MPGMDFNGDGRDDMLRRYVTTACTSNCVRPAWQLGVGLHGRLVGSFILLAALLASPAGAAERRCGWLDNPTPANVWLIDRQGEWLISEQGRYHAPGWDEMPDMSTFGKVTTNVNYGYTCACMVVTTDRSSRRITRIISAKPVPLRQCRRDHRLPSPLVEPDDSGVR